MMTVRELKAMLALYDNTLPVMVDVGEGLSAPAIGVHRGHADPSVKSKGRFHAAPGAGTGEECVMVVSW